VDYGVLRHRLEEAGHGRAAAEWAIHRHVEAGRLVAEPGYSTATPGVVKNGEWVLKPHTSLSRDRERCRLWDTDALWEWWALNDRAPADARAPTDEISAPGPEPAPGEGADATPTAIPPYREGEDYPPATIAQWCRGLIETFHGFPRMALGHIPGGRDIINGWRTEGIKEPLASDIEACWAHARQAGLKRGGGRVPGLPSYPFRLSETCNFLDELAHYCDQLDRGVRNRLDEVSEPVTDVPDTPETGTDATSTVPATNELIQYPFPRPTADSLPPDLRKVTEDAWRLIGLADLLVFYLKSAADPTWSSPTRVVWDAGTPDERVVAEYPPLMSMDGDTAGGVLRELDQLYRSCSESVAPLRTELIQHGERFSDGRLHAPCAHDAALEYARHVRERVDLLARVACRETTPGREDGFLPPSRLRENWESVLRSLPGWFDKEPTWSGLQAALIREAVRVAAARVEQADRRGRPDTPDASTSERIRNWLVARYLCDPTPGRMAGEPVVLERAETLLEFLRGLGGDVLSAVESCRRVGWVEDLRVDIRESPDPTARLSHGLARLNLPLGNHRLIGIRAAVLVPVPARAEPPQAVDSGPPAKPVGPGPAARSGAAKTEGKNIDARMLKVMAENPESHGWSARQWADHLGCSPGTVKETRTWKERLRAVRAMHRADAAARQGKTKSPGEKPR
jgi:hypothetical protein